MQIIKYRKIPFTISAILFLASVAALLMFGLKPGIDFTGGSLMEVKFSHNRPDISEVQSVLSPLDLGDVLVQPSGTDRMLLRMQFLTEEQHQQVLNLLRDNFSDDQAVTAEATTTETAVEEQPAANSTQENVELNEDGTPKVSFELPDENVESTTQDKLEQQTTQVPDVLEERFETIGASISAHLRERSMYAAVAVVLAIIIYIGYAFRRVSKPVQSWKYGVAAIIALVHDVTITMGLFAVLGKYFGVEVGIPFVVSLLTIMGYSVNDTIVVFDRVRENLIKRGSDDFDETVNLGVTQSITRSINTSLTTLLVLVALFAFGGDSIHYFSLALIVGITVGTYSSIFLASPILVTWANWKKR